MTEYRVSERVVLRPGDRFRIGAGPYWRSASGEKIPLAARGICRFVETIRQGAREFVVARCGDGTVILHVAGRRKNPLMPQLVCRPYKIKGKVRSRG